MKIINLVLASLILLFSVSPVFAQTANSTGNDAKCVAIYINGKGVVNHATYETSLAPGEQVSVDIKMKNTGTSKWVYGNHQLVNLDNGIWGIRESTLSGDANNLSNGQETVFSFKVTAPKTVETAELPFNWQMSGGANTGRFGEICSINIKPVSATASKDTLTGDSINLYSQTVCMDNSQNLQRVKASWSKILEAQAYTATFFESTGATGHSSCLTGGIDSFAFPKTYTADGLYTVSVSAYSDAYCQTLVGTKIINVVNGFAGSKVNTEVYSSVLFDLGQGKVNFPLNTCSPFALTLPTPSSGTDIPIKITVAKKSVTLGQVTGPSTVIFRYEPERESSDQGGD